MIKNLNAQPVQIADAFSEMNLQRIAEWSDTCNRGELCEATSIALYRNYVQYQGLQRRLVVTQNIWGRWMARHYPRKRKLGVTVYVGIQPGDVSAI